MRRWRLPASASWMNDSTVGAAAWSSSQAIIAQASTTLSSIIVPGDFGGAVCGQITEEVRAAPEHAAHGVPVGMIPNQPFQDHRLALNVDRNFGANFEIEP